MPASASRSVEPGRDVLSTSVAVMDQVPDAKRLTDM